MKRFRIDPVVLSQIVLALTLVICTLIEPQYLFSRNQGGVSNYGIYRQTGFIFALGFLVAIALLVVATKRHKQSGQTGFARVLDVSVILFGLNLASTVLYKQSRLLDNLHNWVAVVLVIVQLILASYMLNRARHDRQTVISFSLQIIGFILITLTFVGQLHVLFIAEVLVAAGYGWLLSHTALRLSNRAHSIPPAKSLE